MPSDRTAYTQEIIKQLTDDKDTFTQIALNLTGGNAFFSLVEWNQRKNERESIEYQIDVNIKKTSSITKDFKQLDILDKKIKSELLEILFSK